MAGEHLDDLATVRSLLRDHLARGDSTGAAGDIQPLAGGFFSRAYAATINGQEYVVRLSNAPHAAEGFAKDAWAWRHFASPALPIPRAVATGGLGAGAWAISERAPGRTLEEHSPAERRAVLPALLETLDAIGRTRVGASRWYGDWGADGNGRSASWRGYLAAIIENETDGYYRDWHALFRESYLERDVYEAVYRHMLRLAEHCPEERGLIHNDYQFQNLLADDGRITGVIDWANALYGDPLYDVARLGAWSTQPGWWYDDGADLLRARYGALPGYDTRIACYTCHIGLDDLRFYTKTGKRAEYDFFRARLLALIAGD